MRYRLRTLLIVLAEVAAVLALAREFAYGRESPWAAYLIALVCAGIAVAAFPRHVAS